MYAFDPLWLFAIMIPPFIFTIYAQAKVNSAFNKYSKIANARHITGAEAAERLLNSNGLGNVTVEAIKSRLGDHYDPRKKVLRLSPAVADQPSVAALGIVAHEVGHAVQDKTGYAFMKFRSSLVPAANVGSMLGQVFFFLGVILLMAGMAFGMKVIWAGVFLFSLAVIFSLITLPVEYNASNRARQMLRDTGLVVAEEYKGASAVLSAAALTYVAATLQAIATLFYFVLLAMGGNRR